MIHELKNSTVPEPLIWRRPRAPESRLRRQGHKARLYTRPTGGPGGHDHRGEDRSIREPRGRAAGKDSAEADAGGVVVMNMVGHPKRGKGVHGGVRYRVCVGGRKRWAYEGDRDFHSGPSVRGRCATVSTGDAWRGRGWGFRWWTWSGNCAGARGGGSVGWDSVCGERGGRV